MTPKPEQDGLREIVDTLIPRVGEVDGMTEELRDKAIETALEQIQAITARQVAAARRDEFLTVNMHLHNMGCKLSEEFKDWQAQRGQELARLDKGATDE